MTFLDKELFTDLPEGSQREPDVVAQVYTLEGEPELILLHVEIQSKRDREFSYWMYEYYALLWLRVKIPIFPVALYLSPGAGGLTEEVYKASLFEKDILTFNYSVVGLPDLLADDYLTSGNPLGASLSSMMKPSKFGRQAQKYQTLLQLSTSPMDPARKSLLAFLVESNLTLSQSDEAEYKKLSIRGDIGKAYEMINVDELFREHYKSIYEKRGLEQGIEQGIRKGLLQGERNIMLKLLTQKFGEIPDSVVKKIEAIDSEVELENLSKSILDAKTLADMRL